MFDLITICLNSSFISLYAMVKGQSVRIHHETEHMCTCQCHTHKYTSVELVYDELTAHSCAILSFLKTVMISIRHCVLSHVWHLKCYAQYKLIDTFFFIFDSKYSYLFLSFSFFFYCNCAADMTVLLFLLPVNFLLSLTHQHN